MIKDYASAVRDAHRRQGRLARAGGGRARSRGAAPPRPRATSKVKAALNPRIGAALPPGRAPVAAAHRPAGGGAAAGRPGRKGQMMTARMLGPRRAPRAGRRGVSLDADRIRLRSGKTIEGMFIGGDSKTVRILLDDGSVSEVRLEDAVSVEFSARKPKPPRRRRSRSAGARGSPGGPRRRARRHGAGRHIAERSPHADHRRRCIAGGPALPRHRRRPGDGQRLDRHPARRRRDAAGRQGRAVGIDEGQRQDHAEAERHQFGGMVYEVASPYVESQGQRRG